MLFDSPYRVKGAEGELTPNRMAVTCNLHGDGMRGKIIIIK